MNDQAQIDSDWARGIPMCKQHHRVNRWRGATYMMIGREFLFYDERLFPPFNVDDVAVPSKTNWMWCETWGQVAGGLWGWHNGAHAGSQSYAFVDGHAQLDPVQPLNVYWLATGGDKYRPTCGAGANGLYIYTYPPEANGESSFAGAEWWTVPYYPSGPLYDFQPYAPGTSF